LSQAVGGNAAAPEDHAARQISAALAAPAESDERVDANAAAVGGGRWWHQFASFGFSTILHTAVILILSLLVISDAAEQERLDIVVPVDEVAVEELTELQIQSSPEEIEDPEEKLALDQLAAMPNVLDPADDVSLKLETELMQDLTNNILPERDLLQAAAGRSGEGLPHAAELSVFSKRLTRAGAKTGDIQISLIWYNTNDIDLHVTPPSGDHIYYNRRVSRCRGVLDVDMNANGPESQEPVENVYWARGKAPRGKYTVAVHHYASHGAPDPTQYTVMVSVDGEIRIFSGELSYGDPPRIIYSFDRTSTRRRSSRSMIVADDYFPL
jgi:hypothetical protein